MSTHLAAALGLSCLLQLFIVARLGGSLLLHLGVIVAIGGLAVLARNLERRWERLDQSELPRPVLARRFRRDMAQLWLTSVGGSLLWIPVTILVRFLFG